MIERHVDDPRLSKQGGEVYVQNEPGRLSTQLKIGGAPLVAWSRRVSRAAVDPLLQTATTRFKAKPACPADWKEWLAAITAGRPRFLLAMPHTSKHSASASLKIGGTELEAADVRDEYLCLDRSAPPLVALLGWILGARRTTRSLRRPVPGLRRSHHYRYRRHGVRGSRPRRQHCW